MKKLLLAFALSASSIVTYAQYEIRLFSGGSAQGNDISGTQYDLIVSSDGTKLITFQVKNVSGSDKVAGVERLRITDMAAWEDNLCWGAQGDPLGGVCYSAASMSTNPWSTPNSNYLTITDGMSGSLVVDTKVVGAGTEVYRFYVLEGTTRMDSIDVRVISTLGIANTTPDKPEISVYPNPASNYLTVTGNATDKVLEVNITDVLGKAVYSETIVGTKKIDVSEYKNGVYLVSVNEKGQSVLTRRVVVKH